MLSDALKIVKPQVGRDLSLRLYNDLYLIRTAEERIRQDYFDDQMKTPVHLSLGEEAIVAGVSLALSPQDQVFGTYRSHALYLARGGDLATFYCELYGRDAGIAQGKAGSMHLSNPEVGFMLSSAIVSSVIPVAMGAAYANKYLDRDQLTAVFFGDGATEEGVFWETLNASVVKGLPLLLVCENNELAIHAKIQDRQAYQIPRAVRSFGIEVFEAETTCCEDIYLLARQAVSAIKTSGKPALLHLRYHRYLEHVGVSEDYNAGYRCRDDFEDWYQADPVAGQRQRLLDNGVPLEEIEAIEERIDRAIDQAVAIAKEAPFADLCAVEQEVYA